VHFSDSVTTGHCHIASYNTHSTRRAPHSTTQYSALQWHCSTGTLSHSILTASHLTAIASHRTTYIPSPQHHTASLPGTEQWLGHDLFSLFHFHHCELSSGITQHHTAPHSTTQHHTASHSVTQHHTAPHSTIQHHTASHSITQHHTASHSTTQHHTASHSITQHHTASHSITQHHTASHSITHRHTASTSPSLQVPISPLC
jgi:hypothetical protein